MKILITSGPTRAPIDAMRFLSNRSTGRFGTYLAEEALRRGFSVTFVHGVGSRKPTPHRGLHVIQIETNDDLTKVLKRELRQKKYKAMIHAMAVLDYQPTRFRKGKRGTRGGEWIVKFVPTPKVIRRIKKWSPKIFLVGFKLEVNLTQKDLFKRARRLLKESRADMVVANQLSEGKDTKHAGHLLNKEGSLIKKVFGKKPLAKEIVRQIVKGV